MAPTSSNPHMLPEQWIVPVCAAAIEGRKYIPTPGIEEDVDESQPTMTEDSQYFLEDGTFSVCGELRPRLVQMLSRGSVRVDRQGERISNQECWWPSLYGQDSQQSTQHYEHHLEEADEEIDPPPPCLGTSGYLLSEISSEKEKESEISEDHAAWRVYLDIHDGTTSIRAFLSPSCRESIGSARDFVPGSWLLIRDYRIVVARGPVRGDVELTLWVQSVAPKAGDGSTTRSSQLHEATRIRQAIHYAVEQDQDRGMYDLMQALGRRLHDSQCRRCQEGFSSAEGNVSQIEEQIRDDLGDARGTGDVEIVHEQEKDKPGTNKEGKDAPDPKRKEGVPAGITTDLETHRRSAEGITEPSNLPLGDVHPLFYSVHGQSVMDQILHAASLTSNGDEESTTPQVMPSIAVELLDDDSSSDLDVELYEGEDLTRMQSMASPRKIAGVFASVAQKTPAANRSTKNRPVEDGTDLGNVEELLASPTELRTVLHIASDGAPSLPQVGDLSENRARTAQQHNGKPPSAARAHGFSTTAEAASDASESVGIGSAWRIGNVLRLTHLSTQGSSVTSVTQDHPKPINENSRDGMDVLPEYVAVGVSGPARASDRRRRPLQTLQENEQSNTSAAAAVTPRFGRKRPPLSTEQPDPKRRETTTLLSRFLRNTPSLTPSVSILGKSGLLRWLRGDTSR